MATVVPAGGGRLLTAFGDELTFLLDGEQTGGRMTMWLDETPPDGGPPPHYHTDEDETFRVLEGRVAFLLQPQWREVQAGTTVFAPRGEVHAFRNVGPQNSRMLIFTMPSGFEIFYSRCAKEWDRPGGPDMDRISKIAAEHGIHFVTEK